MHVLQPPAQAHAWCARLHLTAPRRVVATCVAAAEELEAWQVTKLQQASLQGRRQVKVEKLCKELGASRQSVLAWLKDQPQLDRAQQSLLEARAAAEAAARERQAVLEEGARAAPRDRGDRPPARGGASSGGAARDRGYAARDPSGMPSWKRFGSRDKHLGRQAEATMEMIFAKTQWPSEEVVSSLWDLHKVRKDKVIEWFAAKRRQARAGSGGGRQQQRSSSSSSSRAEAPPSSGGSGVDWDAEWDKMK